MVWLPLSPALASLCRRLSGFGRDRLVPEQVAACEALAQIGGVDAAGALARLFAQDVFEGPTLVPALAAAHGLGARLQQQKVVATLLRHPDAQVRAGTCRLVLQPTPEILTALIELLDDLNNAVATAAACALGRLGRIEALAPLKRLLEEAPSPDIIEAVSALADRDSATIVLLGRLGRSHPDLLPAALAALESIDQPQAVRIAHTLRS